MVGWSRRFGLDKEKEEREEREENDPLGEHFRQSCEFLYGG
jgi:hypothetical protein